jgi:ATP-dependent helicase/nuclease subunit B
MPTTLFRSRVGAGKTAHALARIAHVVQDEREGFPRAWVLLATKRQEVAFRQRLIDEVGLSEPLFNVEFFNFYALNARLLSHAKVPPRRVDESARLGILRFVARNAREELRTLGDVVETAGFLGALAGFIDELKQEGIKPEDFVAAIASDKDRDLHLLYARYQSILVEKNLVDREGEAWLAEASINPKNATFGDELVQKAAKSVRLFVVDGYDQFTTVQARTIANLSYYAQETLITLTSAHADNPILRRFQEADTALKAAHARVGAGLSEVQGDAPDTRPPDLRHLSESLYDLQTPASDAPPANLRLIEAADTTQEAGAVMRAVKGLLLAGEPADDVLVAVRDWSRYGVPLARFARAYGVPIALTYVPKASETPFIVAFRAVMTLAQDDFPRERVLEALRSPYVQTPLTPADVDTLANVSLDALVVGGREVWLKAIGIVKEEGDDGQEDDGWQDDDEQGAKSSLSLAPQEKTRLQHALEAFFDAVTPPASASYADYVAWVARYLPKDERDPDTPADESAPAPALRFVVPEPDEALPADERTAIAVRDTTAKRALERLLKSLLHVETLLDKLTGGTRHVGWGAWWAEVISALEAANVGEAPSPRTKRVLVTSVTEARGLPHRHVFILGLSEGIFPASIAEDIFYLDSERSAFYERTKGLEQPMRLQTTDTRAADDSLFYELVAAATATLTLSRPTLMDGKLWSESHLWRKVRESFTQSLDCRAYRVGAPTPLEEVASMEELLLAWADAHHKAGWQAVAPLPLAEGERLWGAVQQARAVETYRRTASPEAGAYRGTIVDEGLRQYVIETLNNWTWSASALKKLAQCPYGFFAQFLLKLEPLPEVQEGLDPLTEGNIMHEILHQTYREVQRQGLDIAPENAPTAQAILAGICDAVFADAPTNYGFVPSPMWQEEQARLRALLQAFVANDFSDAPLLGAGRKVEALEKSLRVTLDGVRFKGFVDRIDRDAAGRLLVIDYKRGTTPSLKDVEKGKDYQMWLYLHLVQANVGGESVQGSFYSLKKQELGEKNPLTPDAVVAAEAHARDYIARALSAQFLPQALEPKGGKCSEHCAFYQLCRLTTTHTDED